VPYGYYPNPVLLPLRRRHYPPNYYPAPPGLGIPDCWQETATLVEYAQALTQALLSNTLPPPLATSLTGLLHDVVYLLAEFVKEPYLTVH